MSPSPWPLKGLMLFFALLLPACGDAGADVQSDDAAHANMATAAPEAPEVRVETAQLQASQATLDVTVPAEVEGARDAVLASPAGGYVEKVFVKEGDEVHKGQAIAAIDRRSATARRDQAQAQLVQAQADLDRVKQMGDLASAQQLQGAQTQAQLAQAQADLADIAWQRSMISAPFDGVVGQIEVEVGEVAAPTAPVARVVQLDPVRLTMSVSDRDVVGLHQGMDVSVETDATGQRFEGKLDAISPAADLSTRSFMVKALVDNPDHSLLPGMIARVHLSERLADDAVVIPQDWLVTQRDGIGVYLVEGSTEEGGKAVARWQPVTPGQIVHDLVVIDKGLSFGDTLVTVGHRSLTDGDPLLIARSGSCCENGRVTY